MTIGRLIGKKMKDLTSEFKNEYLSSSYLNNSVDENWTKFKDTLFLNMNKSIPTKKLKNKQDIPWLQKDTKKCSERKSAFINEHGKVKPTRITRNLKTFT